MKMTDTPDKESLTLGLEGKVSLDAFADALSSLSALLGEIEMEITGKDEAEVEWLVTDLHHSNDETPEEASC